MPAALVGVPVGPPSAQGPGTTHIHNHHHHTHVPANPTGGAGNPSSASKLPCKCFSMNRAGQQWVKRGQGFGSHARRQIPSNLQEACECLTSPPATTPHTAAQSNPAFQSDKSLTNFKPPDTRTLPASHPHGTDFLAQRKLLENDRRYRRSRSQRIAPEHGDGTYVNTFGHTIPLKTLGRLDENGDEFSDDCSTTTSGSYDVGQFIVSSPLPQTTIHLEGSKLRGDSTI